jgi:hypothetical protein
VCKQDYAARAPELLIFVADQYRNGRIAQDKGSTEACPMDMDRFFSAFTDACLMAQNVVNAAESMGYGTIMFGSILNDPEKICEVLKLPELTFPVLGLGLGIPAQDPQLKHRMGMEFRIFENNYKSFDNYVDFLKSFDEEMTTYYDLRDANKRVDSFTDQVVQRLKHVIPKRQQILDIIRKQGFDLKV